ncbi:alpha-glucosidase 2-like isoform X1 [Cydia fagiglandana]|uniref:alpha-glucosidase 2-like isoform X1 n=2 Tax=Cydia fagiglandana TaxID=1458189 RepID=UPI002FEE161A
MLLLSIIWLATVAPGVKLHRNTKATLPTTINTFPSIMDPLEITLGGIKSIEKAKDHFAIEYDSAYSGRLYILNGHTFRYFVSKDDFIDFPEPRNEEDVAKMVLKSVDEYDTVPLEISTVEETEESFIIDAEHIKVYFDKENGTMKVKDKRTDKKVMQEGKPLSFVNNKTIQVLVHHKDEHFFGGGMQNGRFAHKGESIQIVNTNNWIDGGVTSPNPFYWSTYGYGVMRNTWQSGLYDFGSKIDKYVTTTHKEKYFDAFYFISPHPKDILLDYFHLTGRPILLPEYAFYQAHLNAFNRDYWVEVTAGTQGAILYEDGKYYKSYQPKDLGNKTGILESLNGELNNYQFSARAMIDRYVNHDMPLGWFIPNDGYGSGYGQTDSLQGDIQNLKEFAIYARKQGVEVALWTESNLEPKDPENPKKGERDLSREVSEADVVALKCDVAWIGYGYSFGLNAVEKATKIFDSSTKRAARPFIIMVDGWAGTQRYAGIWSGDQSGGEWEYIRFHIPTYIGSGLSGQPVVGSDMDGIYRGGKKEVNIRDYQWKAFTPLQLNMDGWGSVPKTPFTFDNEATYLNRAYLKLKSVLMPYTYSINYESIRGSPMVRAMFLEFPEETPAYTNDSKYQYMWGPNILVAPVYTPDPSSNGIYLPNPQQVWIDFFTGDMYQGGKIYNNFKTPLWKIPVFIKNGAIIPTTEPNNNPSEIKRDSRSFYLYPSGSSNFEVYEDDGISVEYEKGHFAKTKVKMATTESNKNEPDDLYVSIEETKGKYKGMVNERRTLIKIMTSVEPKEVEIMSHGQYIPLKKAESEAEYHAKEDVYFVKDDEIVIPFMQDIAAENLTQKFLLIKLKTIDVTKEKVHLKVTGFENKRKVFGKDNGVNSSLPTPTNFTLHEATPTSLTLSWDEVKEAKYYEIERDGYIFSNIIGKKFSFHGFKYVTEHSFRIRSVNDGESEWSDILSSFTKEDPYKNTLKDVKVSCNFPCQPNQEICKLTDGDANSLWHTHWGTPGKLCPVKGKVMKLNFDLGKVHEVEKMEYLPREDAGNGTFLLIQYRLSSDGQNWTPLSPKIYLKHDAETKTIKLDSAFRYIDVHVLDSVGSFGSGKLVRFYKKI